MPPECALAGQTRRCRLRRRHFYSHHTNGQSGFICGPQLFRRQPRHLNPRQLSNTSDLDFDYLIAARLVRYYSRRLV